VAITVNGEACPPAISQSPQFAFAQRIFELTGGTATQMPGVRQYDTVREVVLGAIVFLEDVLKDLDAATTAEKPVGW
jgi:hypothetical protein